MNTSILLEVCGWFVFSCVLMSFIEHQVHSQLMHKQSFLSRRRASFRRNFEAHAITHHKHYLKIFADEPVAPGEDKEIRLNVHKAPIKSAPVAILLAFVSWKASLIFVLTVMLHHWLWNQIHLEMHKPVKRSFSEWPIYKFLARYHYLHHKHPDKNFNVVFPLADYVFGTHAKASDQEVGLMQAEGLY